MVPTVLAASGVKAPERLPGLSLLDAAAGKGKLGREAVFGELFVHTAVDLDKPGLNLTHRWVRAGGWKLIVPHDPKAKPELYEVTADPFERTDLAARQPERVAELRRRLDAWWAGR